jgi:hypothetical protein
LTTMEVQKKRSWGLIASMSSLVLLIGTYTTLVVAGRIPPGQRIDAIQLVLILLAGSICTFLAKPDLLDRLRLLEMNGFKIELEDLRLILPLLFRERERLHLINLVKGPRTPREVRK